MDKLSIELRTTNTGYQAILYDADGNYITNAVHHRCDVALDQIARQAPAYLISPTGKKAA